MEKSALPENGRAGVKKEKKMEPRHSSTRLKLLAGMAALAAILVSPVLAQRLAPAPPQGPWMDQSLSPDRRADPALEQMTPDEKLGLVHGGGMVGFGPPPGAAGAPG